MSGMLFVERWVDKFILASTWLDGIRGIDVYSMLFYFVFLYCSVVLVSWNAILWDEPELHFDWS